MPDVITLTDYMARCRAAEQVSVLWAHALDFLHGRGIKMVSYHSNDAQLPGSAELGIVVDGFPDDWVCHYISEDLARVDPIPHLAAQRTKPFLWSETPRLTRLTPEERGYLAEMEAADLGDGLAMQAHGPNMRNAYVGLGFGGPAPPLSAQGIFELQCAVQICHMRYCELTSDRQAEIEALSAREREILEWMARGKSNSVIAEILGISRHTVDTLARRIFDKLQVHDRTTAAIRGLGSGLVQAH